MTNWSEIVQQHGKLVWKTAFRLLNNEADVGDVYQNAFFEAWKFSQKKHVNNWPGLMRRLAIVESLKRLRQRYRDRHQPLECDEEFSSEMDPSQIAQTNELSDQLRMALTKIDSVQAEVYCLSSLEGLTYREIAAQMQMTTNHVGVLLNRSKTQLRELLKVYRPTQSVKRFK